MRADLRMGNGQRTPEIESVRPLSHFSCSFVRHHHQLPATPRMPPFSVERIDHVVFRVRDLETSIEFYDRVLGCKVVRQRPELGLIHIRAGASMLDLVAIDGKLGRLGGEGPKVEGRNVDHLCLRVEPFDEQRIVAHLRENSVAPRGPASTNFGAEGEGLSLYFCDPDGNVIELKGPVLAAA